MIDMNRRERMIRIIEGLPWSDHGRAKMLSKLGLEAFTDEAIEEWAQQSASAWKRHQRLCRENRTRGAA